MKIRLIRNLALAGVLLTAACADGSDKDGDKREERPSDDESSASGAMAGQSNDSASTASAPLCFDTSQPCMPPEESAGEQPDDVLEVNLTETAGRKDGEPSISINPKDPNNIVAIYASFLPGEASLFG